MRRRIRSAGALAAVFLAAACATGPEVTDEDRAPAPSVAGAPQLTPKDDASGRRLYVDRKTGLDVEILTYDDLPGWTLDDHAAALPAFRRSCAPILRGARPGGFAGAAEDWRKTCAAASTLTPPAMRAFLEIGFTPVRLAPGTEGLATSYYEPVLDARRAPDGRFQHPVYRKPPELDGGAEGYGVRQPDGSLKPFLTRSEIDAGALAGRGLEIAYLADPVDLFFLHIQGSGLLRFRDGETLRVGFAAKNGHPYASVAEAMTARGWARPGQASADYIREFYRRDPARGREALAANKSYIFFTPLDGLEASAGPVGALGVQLTDGRSIAVDRAFVPLGAPVWLITEGGGLSTNRLVVAQDTGSAIKGPQRLDYFWGTGDEAGARAGRVKQPATLTMLLPNALLARLIGAGA